MLTKSLTALFQRPITRQLSTSVSLEEIYDVAIIGGGMVGSALACALGESDSAEEVDSDQ